MLFHEDTSPQTSPVLSARVRELLETEQGLFRRTHPKSLSLFQAAGAHLWGGVPMNWMHRWPGGFPVFAAEGHGSQVRDVDGHTYVDFCLGDTGAMTGHAPDPVRAVVTERFQKGATFMLPTEDALLVAEELSRRFGLALWQFALSATDANRFALRLARQVTGRPKVLVFQWCYHGTVDETFAVREGDRVVARPGNIGAPVQLESTTKVVEMNDMEAVAAALAPGDVAAVLMEPVMTNVGIVHPDPGFHEALRAETRRTGTLLIIDETHTISAGTGGYTKTAGLSPDILTVGKPLGSGIPAAAYGLTEEVARALGTIGRDGYADTGGIGGTLAGNALSLAAMRTTLECVLTESAYERMIALAEKFEQDVRGVIEERGLPWHVTRLGCRVEYLFQPTRPRNGSEAIRLWNADLDAFMHLFLLNRGIMMTPFHNMALMSPATTEDDVARHTAVFAEAVARLVA